MSLNLNDAQLKVLILYALKAAVSPIPQSTLGEILGTCDINYFNIGPVLEEVIETGLVARHKDESETTFLKLSPKGKEIADILKSELTLALRQKVVYVTATELEKLRKNMAIETTITERPNNGITDYIAHLRLMDDGLDIINLSLYCPTKLQAEMIAEAFKDNSTGIYKRILEIFIKR